MSTKGKGKGKGKKGKKGKKDDKNRLTNVDRTFCELTIKDLNQKLSRLRSHLVTLDETNVTYKETLRSLEEDRTDAAAYLTRELESRDASILELEQRLTEITKIRDKENANAAEKISDLEAKYKAMHDQLTSEIKLLNGKLNSLDEFRIQRDNLLAKFDEQDEQLKEKDRAHEEAVYKMEQKAVVEKDALKREVEMKLLQVSEDFTRSSEIRNAGYTRRLIRENIALQKEIDLLVISQMKMQKQYNEQIERHKDMADQYEALDQMKKQLIRNAHNKIKIIEKLTKNYERLRVKYVEVLKFKTMYESIIREDSCERVAFKEAEIKLNVLSKRIETLKEEKNEVTALRDKHQIEVARLRELILQIKTTVESAIECIDVPIFEEPSEDTKTIRQLKRHDLVQELIEIIRGHSDVVAETPSVTSLTRSRSSLYRPGKMGLIPPKQPSLVEIFERQARKMAKVEMIPSEYQRKIEDSIIIPSERPFDRRAIIDVELGSTLYVSSSHEDMEMPQAEDEPLEGEEGESSSSMSIAPQPEPEPKQPSPATSVAESVEPTTVEQPVASGRSISSFSSVKSMEKSSLSAVETEQTAYGVTEEDDEEEMSINLFY